jgi:hypothetical protein
MSSNYENFEVLVKFDSDDEQVPRILPSLETYPFKVKRIIEPRGRGYSDLHIFYNRLFSQADERSVVIGAMADDFEIVQQGWDEVVLSKTNVFPDQIFIIHGRPHPPTSRKDYQEQKFYLDFDIDKLEDLEIIDEAPMWSRKLLDICGGFGHLSFTDCWTLMLEYFLFHRCSMDRTIFLKQPIMHRALNAKVDKPIASRWWTDRANNFAFVRSGFYQTLVEQQALNVYLNIKMLEQPTALKPTLVQRESHFNPNVSVQDNVWARKLRALSSYASKENALTLFPSFMRPALVKIYRTLFPA